MQDNAATPAIVDRASWERARAERMVREKTHTRAGDALAAARPRRFVVAARGPARDAVDAHEGCSQRGDHNMPTGTVQFHRVLKAPAERVFKAFVDADAMAKWLPPHGFTGKVHVMEPKAGGSYRMSFTHFSTGASHAFGGQFLEVVPGERLCHTDRFDDPNLAGEMCTTVTFKPVSCGTELRIVQEGIPAAIPVEACHLGWQESLALLALLVEAQVPDERGA